MLPVGLPYALSGKSATIDAASPYGAIFVSGKQGQQPLTKDHRQAAELLRLRLATLAKKLQH